MTSTPPAAPEGLSSFIGGLGLSEPPALLDKALITGDVTEMYKLKEHCLQWIRGRPPVPAKLASKECP
jgi:hypothetical protein